MTNIAIVVSLALALITVERCRPATRLPKVSSWYARAFLFNGVQAAVAFSGSWLWDSWFAQQHLISLANQPLLLQAGCGYVTITFIYYWWHRARHEVPFLWRHLHQLHHSPARLEVLTSFYKHPGEILTNALLSSATLYLLLGLDARAVGLSVLATGIAELFYHMNIATPRVLGLLFQRPEMHRIHHQRGRHRCNYSDLPIWDMLFGTYANPARVEIETGFPNGNEKRLWPLLTGKELQV